MEKFKIGFIGGCLNNQIGINRDDRYYSIISRNLDKENIKHQILLGTYFHYDQLEYQIQKFIKQKQPNIIYLFIRPYPLLELNKPFIKYINHNKRKTYALHPQLFIRKMEWNSVLSANQTLVSNQTKKSKLFGIQDINIFIGLILGLHKWSLQYLINQLNIVKQICNKNNIKLIVIMPPKYRKSFLSNYVSKSTFKYIAKNLSLPKINIYDIDEFELDKIHLNKYGHKFLGINIYNDIIDTITNRVDG